MASAWGWSWGYSWGNSWGTLVVGTCGYDNGNAYDNGFEYDAVVCPIAQVQTNVNSGFGHYRVSPRRQRGFHYPHVPLPASSMRNDDTLALLLIGAL
jgi:hypothetical protein